jgi:calcineurin-like phosphoesterase family protein
MNEVLIENWNKKVSPNDLVYHMGDFAFSAAIEIEQILKRLNGKKIIIFGNHDKQLKNSKYLWRYFEECVMYKELTLSVNGNNQAITLSHYAHLVWNKSHHGAWMLHGHSHGTLQYPFKGKIMDVGVDSNNFSPISLYEVHDKMKSISTESFDHHR